MYHTGGKNQTNQPVHFPNGGFPPVYKIEQQVATQLEQNRNRQFVAIKAVSIKDILAKNKSPDNQQNRTK